MQYRGFGKLDWQVSALGFGAMRLPTRDDKKINEPEAIRMMRYAIDNGVNYIDTAWPYHSGESESVVGRALEDGYRQRVQLATKLPSWELKTREDMDSFLNRQLERLQTDRIDCYLLHALNRSHWETYQKLDVLSWIPQKIREGKIGHIGFSFHAEHELFREIVDAYDWDLCQIQYNFLDTEFQAGLEGLRYAHSKGLAVVVMEPLRGGQLAAEPTERVKEIWDEAEVKRSPADWALEWLWNQPEVATVLSGMSTMEQVEQNIESAVRSRVGVLTQKELELIDRASHELRGPIGCTRCDYCMPCPQGVKIPENFALYNTGHVVGSYDKQREQYGKLEESSRASACIECGECEPKCPQTLKIMSLLGKVSDYFEQPVSV